MIHGLHRSIFIDFSARAPFVAKMSTARGMNFIKAKRILTGLPDDRKNFFSSTGAARQKNSGRLFYYPFRRITRNRLIRRRAPAHFRKARTMMILQLIALFAVSWFASSVSDNDKWPQFLGPQSVGVVEDPQLPDKWSATENVAWKTDIPGLGWSSPIVWGDRIFVTSVISSAEIEPPKKGLYFGGERGVPKDEHRWMIYCVDWKTGKILWEREAHRGAPQTTRHLKNSYASETPVTDGERVYAYFGNLGLFCFDFKGNPVWKQNFEHRKTRFGWGTAASPVLYKDRIYVVNDNDEQSFFAAYDKKTGKEVWKVEREVGTNCATPYIWENKQRTEIILPATKAVRSYDLNGKVLDRKSTRLNSS